MNEMDIYPLFPNPVNDSTDFETIKSDIHQSEYRPRPMILLQLVWLMLAFSPAICGKVCQQCATVKMLIKIAKWVHLLIVLTHCKSNGSYKQEKFHSI